MCFDNFCINQDKIGVPIGLSYRDNQSYKTRLGGCSSFCATMSILAFTVSCIYTLFYNPSYNETTTISYIDQSIYAERDVYVLDINEFIFAVQILNKTTYEVLNDTSHFVPQFFSAATVGDTDAPLETIFYDAVPCIDLIEKKVIAQSKTFTDEINSSWLCPNIHTFELYNDPYAFSSGSNFNFVLNYCQVAYGIDDTSCKTLEESEK